MVAPEKTVRGRRITLSPFTPERISDRYLAWLSDPVVNEYSRRRNATPANAADARQWLASLDKAECVLAVDAGVLGHIGNVKFGPVDDDNRRADISIMIGERAAWGQGYGAEAIYTVARFLFSERGLNRVDAGSANPAFLAMVRKLGWVVEGVQRQRVRLSDRFVDWTLVAQLAADFIRMPDLEPL